MIHAAASWPPEPEALTRCGISLAGRGCAPPTSYRVECIDCWTARARQAEVERDARKAEVGRLMGKLAAAEALAEERHEAMRVLREQRDEARAELPAWACPSCGAETRARMADHDDRGAAVTDDQILRTEIVRAARAIPITLAANARVLAAEGRALTLNYAEADALADALMPIIRQAADEACSAEWAALATYVNSLLAERNTLRVDRDEARRAGLEWRRRHDDLADRYGELVSTDPAQVRAERNSAQTPVDRRPRASLKTLREDLCRHQSHAGWPDDVALVIAGLLDVIDTHRPLGPNGKHGDRHTTTCGCEDAGQEASTHG